jgi:Schlafen, AlbA_2
MIPRELTAIRAEDVQRLLQDNEPESVTLEYKRGLDPNQRVGLLKTVCAFANTGTGDVVFGMEEDNHYPCALPGIPQAEVEQTKLRIEQWVRTGIEPPSVTVRPWPVDLGNGNWALVVRVERSWAGPHRVKEDGRFHRRHSAGHCEMTIEELRRAFTEAELLAEGVRRFRDQRLDLIHRTITPVKIQAGPRVVLHIVPVASVRGGFQIDVHQAYERIREVTALSLAVESRGYNLDGVVAPRGDVDEAAAGYIQVFRSGVLEGVAHLNSLEPDRFQEAIPNVDGAFMPPERRVVPALPGYLEMLEHLGVPWPIYGLVSLVRANNYVLWTSANAYSVAGPPLADSIIPLREVELPRDPEQAVRALRPVFDIVWQAFGIRNSPNFDNDDNFREPRR